MSIKFYTSLHYSQFCKRAAARQYVVPGGVDVIPDGTIVNAHERVLAGCAGTALHLGLFMRGGGTVIQIKRNRKTKDSFDVQNMINSAKGHNGIYIAASVEPVRTQHSTNMPQIIGLTKHLRKFFDENGFKYDSSLVAPDALDRDAYATAMAQFRATSSSPFVYNVKKLIIKLVACFIPGRVRRGRVRQRMKRWLTHN